MEILKVEFFVMAVFALVISLLLPSINAQSLAPAPAPTSDENKGFAEEREKMCAEMISGCGVAVDQGIAYGLMVLALLLTYIIH